MTEEKCEEIVNNKINGNISIFKEQINKLSKYELLYLIQFWVQTDSTTTYQDTILDIARYLN